MMVLASKFYFKKTTLSATIRNIFLFIVSLQLQLAHSEATLGLVVPRERITGLGCIPEGRTVSYECTVTDTSDPVVGSTIWSGSAFQCPRTSNRISLPHSQFPMVTPSCGNFSAMAVRIDGDNFVSQLSLRASSDLNGTTIACSLSGSSNSASDVLQIGVPPPPPGPLTVTFSPESPLTASWSPPSGPVEGGVGGYTFDVTGEGCGCVSMNISANTTSVTCSGWIAVGQTCSFEARTVSQDCGFLSLPVHEEAELIACDPSQLGANPTSNHSKGAIAISGGVIKYNGVVPSSTAYLMCDNGFVPGPDSTNRSCLSNGTWSGSYLIHMCSPIPSFNYLAAIILIIIILPAVVVLLSIGGISQYTRHPNSTRTVYSEGGNAPLKLIRPTDAVVDTEKKVVYFRQNRTRKMFKYDIKNCSWSTLPRCLVSATSLVMVKLPHYNEPLLHTVGGSDRNGGLVGNVYYLKNSTWKKSPIPPMIEKRMQVAAVSKSEILVTAGGRSKEGPVKTVEFIKLDPNTDLKWITSTVNLPRAVFRASGFIIDFSLYILGGCVYNRELHTQADINSAYKISLNDLCKVQSNATFDKIEQVQDTLCSSFASSSTHIYAVGGSENDPRSGREEAICSKKIYVYNPANREHSAWKLVGELEEARCYSFTVCISENQLLVVGGNIHRPDGKGTKSVEIKQLDELQDTENSTEL